MEIHNQSASGRALKYLSYALLAAGFALLAPFVLLAIVKRVPIGPLPASLFANLYALGGLVLVGTLFAVPGLSLWVRGHGDREDLIRYVKLSVLRVVPVVAVGVAQLVYAASRSAFQVTALYALALAAYAIWLLWRDRSDG